MATSQQEVSVLIIGKIGEHRFVRQLPFLPSGVEMKMPLEECFVTHVEENSLVGIRETRDSSLDLEHCSRGRST